MAEYLTNSTVAQIDETIKNYSDFMKRELDLYLRMRADLQRNYDSFNTIWASAKRETKRKDRRLHAKYRRYEILTGRPHKSRTWFDPNFKNGTDVLTTWNTQRGYDFGDGDVYPLVDYVSELSKISRKNRGGLEYLTSELRDYYQFGAEINAHKSVLASYERQRDEAVKNAKELAEAQKVQYQSKLVKTNISAKKEDIKKVESLTNQNNINSIFKVVLILIGLFMVYKIIF